MKRFRVFSTMLISASLMTLAACGGEDTTTTAGSTPSATTASSAAASASSAPSASTGTTAAMSDKELCEAVEKAGNEMRPALAAAMQSALQSGEEPSPVVFKEILTGLEQKITKAVPAGANSEAATAVKRFAAEAAKAAAAKNPVDASENPAFEKAGADITAACKAAGVTVNF
ncbi:hypothetical protein ACFOW4_16175 [Micromonospora sp. GCM10011542]|uniref:hypothetical protein n=1 Tax=Micromonospora sp. GCM10011542 TaxID=3317337 RepID=UPI0036101C08